MVNFKFVVSVIIVVQNIVTTYQKKWLPNGDFDVETWRHYVALQLFLNRETYRKFEME